MTVTLIVTCGYYAEPIETHRIGWLAIRTDRRLTLWTH
jgi:hypothetical protein